MRRLLIITTALAALAATAAAPPPVRRTPPPGVKITPTPAPVPAPKSRLIKPQAGGVVVKPDWESLPTGDDLERLYPEAAARKGIGGKAVISCKVTATGTLEACEVISEDPPGENFGAAAIRMASLFKMKPTTLDGLPVEGGTVRIPIVFQAPEDSPGPTFQGLNPGPSANPGPTTGRFVWVGVETDDDPQGGLTGDIYLKLPDGPPTDGKVSTWFLIVFDNQDAEMHSLIRQEFDCSARQVRPVEAQLYLSGEPLGWTSARDEWISLADSRPFMTVSLDLVCGNTQPKTPELPDLAAATKDARARTPTKR